MNPAMVARGWRKVEADRNKVVICGYYCGPWGRIPGKIVIVRSPIPGHVWVDFYILSPPRWLTSRSPFDLCLRKSADNEYAIHWKSGHQPRSILAGIFSIERSLAEAFLNRRRV